MLAEARRCKPAGANVMSANSVINIDNTAGSRFNPNGFNQTIAGLSGGGATQATLPSGEITLRLPESGTTTSIMPGRSALSAGTIFMGRVKRKLTKAIPTGPIRTVALSSKDAVQTLGGAAMNITGPTTVHVGTLNYAPSVPTTIGGDKQGDQHHSSDHSAVRSRNLNPAKPAASAD